MVAFWTDGGLDASSVGTTELTPVVGFTIMVADLLGLKLTLAELIAATFKLLPVGVFVREGFNAPVDVAKFNALEFFGTILIV